MFIWVWFDDDSNYDTHDRKPEVETDVKPFGNTFDLGDMRANYPVTNLQRTFLWVTRNTFYNFNYMFEEVRENDKNFFYVQFPKLGWHFGYIPYTNSKRCGRLVYFSEDFDKLDIK